MTIKQIADSLGVSTATVSNVIHGHLEKMSPETAQNIREQLEKYQYIPNMGARMLAKGDSEIVGVITNYPNREEKLALQDPFVSEMLGALENAIRANGYFTMACGSLSGYSGAGLYQQFLERFGDHPYVVLQEKVNDEFGNRTSIVIENYQSYYQCVQHIVVDHGYRRIAYVSGPAGHPDARERLRAFEDVMAKYHVPVSEKDIVYGDFSEYVDMLVERLLAERPDLQAIIFANDEMAKAGYRVCEKLGLVVGRDIAITGFDNLRSALQMEPPLSTVWQDTYRMGTLAIESIMALLAGKHAECDSYRYAGHREEHRGRASGKTAGIPVYRH